MCVAGSVTLFRGTPLELHDYWRIIRKHWVMITATTLAVMGLTATYTLIQTPQYQSTTELYISVRTGEGTLADMAQGSGYARQAIDSYVDVVTTSIVTDEVARQMGGDLTSESVKKKLTSASPKDTVLIQISASDANPQEAAELANVTASVFSEVVSGQLEKPAPGSPTRVTIDIVEPAQVASKPVSPNPQRNLALGVLLGLALGLGAAVLRDVLDTKVRSRREIQDLTDVAVIGQVSFDPDANERPLVVHADPLSPRSEAFRSLRTNLRFLRVDGNPTSFVITSPQPGEGKSTTAANLAISLAESGSKVCLVDADLRKPRLAELLGLEGGMGLTDVIIGRVALADALQEWGGGNLTVLPSGQRPPNPSELLGSAEMAELIEALRSEFDYVIVDAPPTLVVTDAAVIDKHVEGALLVAAVGQTRKDALVAAIDDLESIDGNLMGIILTKVPANAAGNQYYSSYYMFNEEGAPDLPVNTPANKWGMWGFPAEEEPTKLKAQSVIIDAGSK